MKNLYLFIFLLATSFCSVGQNTLYSETFTGQNGKGATRGIFGGTNTDVTGVTWSIDISSASLDGSGFLGNGDYFAVVDEAFSGKDTDGNAIWYSPSVTITGYTNVSFSLGMTSSGSCENNDSFTTQYRLNGTGAWTNAATNGAITNDPSGNAATINQTGLSGNSIQIRVIISTNQDDDIYTFDNVLVTGVLPCTTTPVNVSALTATPASQQVTLNWTNSTCFDEVLVVAKQGSAVTATPTGNGSAYTANAAFGSGTQITANEYVVYKGTGTNVNVTSLTNNLTYHFRVFTRKGTNWSTGVPVNATPAITYCPVTGRSAGFDDGVTNVTFNTINNTSSANAGNEYSNFTNISTSVNKGSTYPLSVRVNTDGNYTYYQRVWIDWNQNGSFEDSGEQYDLGTATNVTNGLSSLCPLNVTVPTTAVIGSTRMRVSSRYLLYAASCDTDYDGEIEDYSINVTPPVTYVFNNGWTPANPNGVSTSLNDIIIANGTAVFTGNTQSNTITVNPTGAVTVNSGVTLSSANGMTLQSNATQYSSLLSNGTITGTVSYNRHVNGGTGVAGAVGSNDLISAPVTGQTFSSFVTANPNIKTDPNNANRKLFGPFNKTTGTYDLWINTVAQQANNTLNAGVGYRAASTDNGGFIFTGTPNNGVVTNNIVNSGPQFAAYNLIGNPYPSYINVRDFLEYDVDPGAPVVRNIDLMDAYGAIYGYDGNSAGAGSSGWVVYNLTTATTVNLAPGQGFLVTADAADVAAYDMTFTPSMRRIGTTDDFIPGRLAEENNVHVKLQAAIGSANYNTDIFFIDNTTSGLDFGYDAGMFGSNAPATALYSQLVENNTGIDLAIQSLAYTALGSDIIVPIGINVPQGQQVTVSIAESDLPSNIEVYLEDNVTGTFTLLNTSDYTFTPSSNLTDTGRFFLRFTDATLSTPDTNVSGLQIYATASPRALFVKGQLASATSIHMYDVQGREVLSSTLKTTSNSNQIDVSNLSSGVYVVKLNNSTQQKTQKVILK
ncbi:MAG: GEVED domain-containing protein [Gelidibacter sp.]